MQLGLYQHFTDKQIVILKGLIVREDESSRKPRQPVSQSRHWVPCFAGTIKEVPRMMAECSRL